MDNREQLRRITELTEQIAGLPKGYLSKKTIGGKVYYYHQWSENGVKQSRYLHGRDRKSTRLNSSHRSLSRMPSSA